MSADEDTKIQKWWDIIKDNSIVTGALIGASWDELAQSTQIKIKKAYRAAAKLDNLSVDRAGITFIGKIPEGHAVEFIVRSDRTYCRLAGFILLPNHSKCTPILPSPVYKRVLVHHILVRLKR